MLIFLLYGDNEMLPLNANCGARTFFDYVKKKCNFDDNMRFDFCTVKGKLTNVINRPGMQIIAPLLKEKRLYIPVVLERNEDLTFKVVQPLLDDWEKRYPDLEKNIKELNGPVILQKSYQDKLTSFPDRQRKGRNANRDTIQIDVATKKSSVLRTGRRKAGSNCQ